MAASDDCFRDVVRLLGLSDLRELYYALGISGTDVEKWERDAGEGASCDLKAMKVLECWRKREGRDATRYALLEGLKKGKNEHARLHLEMLWRNIFGASGMFNK